TICPNPFLCSGGREGGSHRGWAEEAPSRLRSSKNPLSVSPGAVRPDRIVGGLRKARAGSVPPPIWVGDVSRGRGVRGGGRCSRGSERRGRARRLGRG